MDNKDYENKMKELNGLSVVDRMNMYKERMAEQSRKLEEDNKKYNQNSNNKNLKDYYILLLTIFWKNIILIILNL